MTAYYNEHDPFAAAWLRNLIASGHIAPGVVDERSIEDVRAADLVGFAQVHFFAGIGGWSHALRLAGWPDVRPINDGYATDERRTAGMLRLADAGYGEWWTWSDERQHAVADAIAIGTVRVMLPPALRATGVAEDLVAACEAVTTLNEAASAAWAAAWAASDAAMDLAVGVWVAAAADRGRA